MLPKVMLALLPTLAKATKPHLVMALIDDLGWHDVGWHNDELKCWRSKEYFGTRKKK